jgi:hypothetical protein
LVRIALRRDALAASPIRDQCARSTIDTLSCDPPFPRPLRMAGTLGSMLLRLLSLIDPLAASPSHSEVKSREDPRFASILIMSTLSQIYFLVFGPEIACQAPKPPKSFPIINIRLAC